jgi:hypothetical protein
MAVLVDVKNNAGPSFPNAVEVVRATWDFAVDGGSVTFYDALVADAGCIVSLRAAIVKTAVTSGGSLTLDLGKGAAGTEMISNKAVASMTLNNITVGAAPVYLAANEKISMNIEVAAATAGKIEFIFEVVKA